MQLLGEVFRQKWKLRYASRFYARRNAFVTGCVRPDAQVVVSYIFFRKHDPLARELPLTASLSDSNTIR